MEIGDRIRFWRRVLARRDTFLTNDTGDHVSIDSYNPITDRVTYRVGKFGYYELGFGMTMDRREFLAHGAKSWRAS